jgi:hypothetical protein
MSINKQLIINNFNINGKKLPMDVINIIKNFIFYNEINKTKNKKNILINRIKSLHYTSLDYGEYQLNYTGFIFEGNYPNENNTNNFIINKPHIYCDFCLKCGNYQNNTLSNRNNKIICSCLRTLPLPYFWTNEWVIYWKS